MTTAPFCLPLGIYFPFFCLTVVTLQTSTKLWAMVDGERDSGSQHFWDIKIDVKSNIAPHPTPQVFFPHICKVNFSYLKNEYSGVT